MAPAIIATWKFGRLAFEAGWPALASGGSAFDAVEIAANAVEESPDVSSVGYSGIPNAEGVVELDAVIMDGRTHAAGAVGGLTGIRKPISVARQVMEKTPHVFLVGNNARRFALQHGFATADLLTEESHRKWLDWKHKRTAPDVVHFADQSHDTVGVCAVDANGDLAAACTTSGISFKTPGRVGDSPIVGSGLYVDNEVGAAAATGNGDEIMKVCLSYRVVYLMESGRSPQEACEESIRYLLRKRPSSQDHGAAVIALDKDGRIGAAATQEGFRAPDRLWHYCFSRDGQIEMAEGPYVSQHSIRGNLAGEDSDGKPKED